MAEGVVLGKHEREALRILAEGPARSSDFRMPAAHRVLRRLEQKGLVVCVGPVPGAAEGVPVLLWTLA